MKYELTPSQEVTFKKFKKFWKNRTKPLFQYDGGAGRGKTFMSYLLLEYTEIPPERIAVVAYTGRAAYNLIIRGLNAMTTHRFLYSPKTELIPIKDPKTGEHMKDKDGNMQFNKRLKWDKNDAREIAEKFDVIFIDEGYMVPTDIAEDIVKIGLPVIVTGDTNQLKPVSGEPYFLQNPDSTLIEITRQAEGDPIVLMADDILKHGHPNKEIYGPKARVSFLSDKLYNSDKFLEISKKSDIMLCNTNNFRQEINDIYREYILDYPPTPVIGDRIICRKNNWGQCLEGIPLVNGLMGTITSLEMVSKPRNIYKMDFKLEGLDMLFTELLMNGDYITGKSSTINFKEKYLSKDVDYFQYANCITTHLSQGSEWGKVIYMDDSFGSFDDKKRARYTAVTRAKKNLLYFEL